MIEHTPCFSEEQLSVFGRNTPARMIIAGYSNSGKSYICTKLIEKYHQEFAHIVICGVEKHELQQRYPQIVTTSREIIDPLQFQTHAKEAILFVLDDTFMEAINSKIVVDTFTKGRHSNLSVVFITQNIFGQGKYARTITLNASHIILTRNRDICQVETLMRQLFGKKHVKDAVEIYKKAVYSRPFGYLMIDLSPHTPDILQLRSNILGEDPCELVYQLTS